MLAKLKYITAVLVLFMALAIGWGWTPDIDHETLAQKYARGASDFVDLPSGARAHFRIEGNSEGPTILLLHGSNASLHTWEDWVDALETDHLVVSVDLPGHGLTGPTPAADYTYDGMAAFVDEFAASMNIDRFILAGNSMGGAVTLAYALKYPDHLQGIILVDAAGIPVPESAKAKVSRPLAFQLAGHWYANWILEHVTPRSIVEEGLNTAIVDHSLITDAMIDRYWELARHPGNREATALRFAWYRTADKGLPVENIKLPTLILWGEADSLIPLEVGQEMAKRIEGARLVTYPNIGHVPMEEIPAISANAVRAFVATLPE